MKLTFLELCGFRGYRKPLRIEFSEHFTIIDGRNGTGKSTIFDAIEFALTGQFRKYEDQKASGETIADYVWWRGEDPGPKERFVRVGFKDGVDEFCVSRTEFSDPNTDELSKLEERLCDRRTAPKSALSQLCANAIIRDEQITKLSLDMRETDRYALLRDGLGAIDSEQWIQRGSSLLSAAKRRADKAEKEVTEANTELALRSRRLDEIRASIVSEAAMSEVVSRLQNFSRTSVPADQLAGVVRSTLAAVAASIELLEGLENGWNLVEKERSRLPELKDALERAEKENRSAAKALEDVPAPIGGSLASEFSEEVKDLVDLVALGRKLGLSDDHCPLCSVQQSSDTFEKGVAEAELRAESLNKKAAAAAELAHRRGETERQLDISAKNLEAANIEYVNSEATVKNFNDQRESLQIQFETGMSGITSRLSQLRTEVEKVENDLRILETLRASAELEKVQRAETAAKEQLARAQEKLGRKRKAKTRASELFDAARRAASETLDRRLERVLPLMSELYRRLRPHPYWSDIEYSIRGDVRRFLKLQVGEDLNPQFLFSSGQRRATGLAFLLSVNLSLAWSRWHSVLLDDPVQHVDDFRTVNLAELMAQLVTSGRQIICSVEDAALADLLCRRLPVTQTDSAKRITLGADLDGALSISSDEFLIPHMKNAVVSVSENRSQQR